MKTIRLIEESGVVYLALVETRSATTKVVPVSLNDTPISLDDFIALLKHCEGAIDRAFENGAAGAH